MTPRTAPTRTTHLLPLARLRQRRALAAGAWLATAALLAQLAGDARGEGVAQVMTSKSLPDATVAVIDPESGTSSGTSGSDVRIAVGDIILFRFAFTPVPDKINRGLQGYLTEYLPPNTQVVGVRFIDAAGNTIEPRYPGIAVDGCLSGGCNVFNGLPCSSGTCNFLRGSIAQMHADTGVFFTSDSRLNPVPLDQFLTMDNGITMSPEPRSISPGIVALLNDTTGPYRAHNQWDWTHVKAYGFTGDAAGGNGTGNTPFHYGSPVAGPDTYYDFEATEVGNAVQFNNAAGPWQRIRYPGSLKGFGAAITGNNGIKRMVTEIGASVGFDLTPANPATATALRFALGETRTGQPGYVEVALRVTGVPLDPTFGTAGGNVDCGEVVGSDTSSRGGNSGGKDNPWPTYVASPACVFLKLLFDLSVDKQLAVGNDTLHYRIRGTNLSVNPETGVVARMKFDPSRQSYVSGTPAPASVATCSDDSTKSCVTWNLGTLAPSADYLLDASFTVGGGGQTSNVLIANYTSTQLPAPGFSTQALTIVTGIAVPRVALQNELDPTDQAATAGGTTGLVGTIANIGTAVYSGTSLGLVLPTGWSVNGNVTVGTSNLACAVGCGTATPTYNLPLTFDPGQTRSLGFRVNVPSSTSAGLYRIDVQLWGGQPSFGGDFETYFPKAVKVAVGQRQSLPPTITCPVGSTATSVTGSSEASAAVRLYFNLIQRGAGTASGAGAWTVNDFGAFGELYGGLEVRASAQVPGELESALSEPCFVTAVRACSDGLDNDGDGQIDFPADTGCDSPSDNSEINAATAQCADGLDNDGDGQIDFPADSGCGATTDATENNQPACADGIDNDGDGQIDFPADADCSSAADGTEVFYRRCQNGLDDDNDGRIDFDGRGNPALIDPGCHSAFDDDETDVGFSPIDTKPRLLIVFDSSGSMNWNTCADVFTGGDGTDECRGGDVACVDCTSASCGNNTADDSRLFKVKAGISDAVAAFGEVEYGLMRFHQRATSFGCPGPSAGLSSGGWQGGGAAPCSGGFAAGDVLVSFADENEQSILGWMDGDSNYSGVAPTGTDMEIRGSGTTPLAGVLSSAFSYIDGVRDADDKGACRPYRVILVTDGQETCGGNPQTAATLLHDAGVPVHVIGFATSDQTIVSSLDGIAAAGGTGSAIVVDDEAALSTAVASIITDSILVELCNGADDDCDALIDEDFPDRGDACDNGQAGVCLATGTRVCRTDGLGTVCNAPPVTPGTESCNGLDDDCDQRVDEGLGPTCTCVVLPEVCNGADDDCDGFVDEAPLPGAGNDCGIDIGVCEPGVLACVGGAFVCQGGTGPTVEQCNLLDDDCDTFVDEVAEECYTFPSGCQLGGSCTGVCRTGLRTCTPQGTPGSCAGEIGPSPERCNGLDDDCDGLVDEAFPTLGDSCSNGQVGACLATGSYECAPGGNGVVCTAPTVQPGLESCNGLDDDCDTFIDEALGPPEGNSCGGGTGCTTGTLQCIDGAFECTGSTGGSAESCNGLDDDCDTFIDEGTLPGTGEHCTDPGYEGIGETGECEYGTLICQGGAIVCDGYVGPQPEICNGLDDDCDGIGDAEAQCVNQGDVCVDGQCAFPCATGEFPCPFGFYCADLGGESFCVPDPCLDIPCPQGSYCDPPSAACVDLCDAVSCTTGAVCQEGICLDCFTLGCAADELCLVNRFGIGVCQADPCAGVSCESGEYCRDGDCIPLACDPACATGESCVDGVCQADPCADVECPTGSICQPSDGACVHDDCLDRTCPIGEACRPSDHACIPDPCLTIDCPTGFVCDLDFDGDGVCQTPPVPDVEVVTAAGGGGCAAAGSSGLPDGSAALLLAAAALLVRRRRRPRPVHGG